MGTDTKTKTYAIQREKSERYSHIVKSTMSSLINSFYETSITEVDKQAVIETAQDFGLNELSDILIERFNCR